MRLQGQPPGDQARCGSTSAGRVAGRPATCAREVGRVMFAMSIFSIYEVRPDVSTKKFNISAQKTKFASFVTYSNAHVVSAYFAAQSVSSSFAPGFSFPTAGKVVPLFFDLEKI